MDQPRSTLVTPGVYLLDLPPGGGNVYVWQARHGVTLIDTGLPGSARAVLAGLQALGHRPSDVVEIVLTHFHRDHTGSAAELARHTGARVLAHPADAAVIAGRQPPVPPSLTELELSLAEMIFGDVSRLPGPAAPPLEVDPVDDGYVTAGGGTIVATPGHTPGSIALLVADVLFTGDTIASFEGAPILGPFNIDRPGAIASVRKQALLDYDTACVGHGQPLVGGANRKVLAMIRSF
ncbi:MAG: MBL fold metallo-hydrolase [Chloroflexi bacterium]|nr:MBL fold metallo-hydrolase [Chloroflexota bacterium]